MSISIIWLIDSLIDWFIYWLIGFPDFNHCFVVPGCQCVRATRIPQRHRCDLALKLTNPTRRIDGKQTALERSRSTTTLSRRLSVHSELFLIHVATDLNWNKKLSYRRGTARRAVFVKTVLNVAQIFVELHLISPASGEWPSSYSRSLETARIWLYDISC